MLGGQLVVRPDDRPIQQRPDRFDGVGVNLAPDVLAVAVRDDLVSLADPVVGLVLVGVEDRFLVNVGVDEVGHDLVGNVRLRASGEPHLTASFDDSHYGGLVLGVTGAFTADGSADVELVGFDHTGEFGGVGVHSGTNPVAQVPTRLGGDPEGAGELVGAHTLLGFDQKEGGEEPFPERKLGVLEDGSDPDGELILTTVALEELASLDPSDFGRFTLRAGDAIRPPELFQGFDALVFGAVLFDQFRKVHSHNNTGQV